MNKLVANKLIIHSNAKTNCKQKLILGQLLPT